MKQVIHCAIRFVPAKQEQAPEPTPEQVRLQRYQRQQQGRFLWVLIPVSFAALWLGGLLLYGLLRLVMG